jgi:hypothetical protein
MDKTRLEQLDVTYRDCLREARRERPDLYQWPERQVDEIADKMLGKLRESGPGVVDIGGPAWRMTCKALGFRPTYKNLRAFLKGKQEISPT